MRQKTKAQEVPGLGGSSERQAHVSEDSPKEGVRAAMSPRTGGRKLRGIYENGLEERARSLGDTALAAPLSLLLAVLPPELLRTGRGAPGLSSALSVAQVEL